jgi:uncharacterized protein (DUF1697 family)
MPRYVAFLRAINVGGAHTVRMEVLRRAFEALGFSGVTSYTASGNIIFETPARNTAALENRIEEGLMEALGYEVIPFVRSCPELAKIAGFKPFPKSRFDAGDQLGVVFLAAPLEAKVIPALKALQTPTDELQVEGRQVYWLRHRTAEGLVYSTVAFEKALAQPFTIRGVSTVRKIAEKYAREAQRPGAS